MLVASNSARHGEVHWAVQADIVVVEAQVSETSTDSQNFKEKYTRMLDFRKAILFAVAGLGLVGAANAQVVPNCTTVTSGGAPIVSVEGTTELLPVETLNCPTAGTGNGVTIVISSNVPFTNASSATTGLLDVVATAQTSAGAIAASSVSEAGNALTATFNLGGATLTSITFSGLRVNANAVPNSSVITLIPSGIAGGGITTSGATATTAANVLISLLQSSLAGQGPLSLCGTTAAPNAPPLATGANSANPKSVYQVTQLTIQENFNAAFKTGGAAVTVPPGGDYSAVGSIAATQGTRLAVTFNNLNANINYYVPGVITSVLTPSLSITAYNAPAGGTPATTVSVGTVPAATAGLVPLTVTNGSATIYYGVTTESLTTLESAVITLFENVPNLSTVIAVSTSQVTANVSLVGVAAGYPQFATQAVTTVNQLATSLSSLVTACSTTLLFPYAVNIGGFDMGVAITNASTGIAGLSATSGACNVTFYGAGAPTAPANVYNTGTIATAGIATFLISGQAPGLSGYAVAVCNFTGAHGYAFITDGFGGGGRGLSGNYLAIVTASAAAGAALPVATF